MGKNRPASGSGARPTTAELVNKLSSENLLLKSALDKEKKAFSTSFIKDMRAPERRRIGPMKNLVSEQSEAASGLITSASEKQIQLNQVLARVTEDTVVQNRRQEDVGRLQQRLESLEDELLEADADAAEACDREDTYTMMDARLQSLVTDDQVRINAIQRVINESALRLNQWHAVSKEGEAELASAEVELTSLRTKQKAERHSQRKMMTERRSMVENMVKYTTDRNNRMKMHQDRLMASRGDLDAEGEATLKLAAGTSNALRAMEVGSQRSQMSFEEKCKEAFNHIEHLTGASDLNEVLYIITSKKELTDQLQRRVASTEQRIQRLTEERDAAEAQASEEQYGVTTDAKTKTRLEEARERMGTEAHQLQEASKRTGDVMRLLQNSRLAWENLIHLLEPGREPGRAAGYAVGARSRPQEGDALLRGDSAAGTPAASPPDGRRARRSSGGDDAASAAGDIPEVDFDGMLPVELAEMPLLIDEVLARAERVMQMTSAAAEAQLAAQPPAAPASPSNSLAMRLLASPGGAPSGEGDDAAAPTTTQQRKGSRGGGGGGIGAMSGSSSSNNIRVVPPEMLDSILEAAPAGEDTSRGRTPGSRGTTRGSDGGVAFKAPEEQEDDLLSREDLKAVSTRISRKAMRRQAGPKSK